MAALGIREDVPLFMADYDSSQVDYSAGAVYLGSADLIQIDRIRFVTDQGYPFLDLSYCWGTLRDGRHVRVQLDITRFGKRTYKAQLIALARAAGKYAKGMGMLDDDTISILW